MCDLIKNNLGIFFKKKKEDLDSFSNISKQNAQRKSFQHNDKGTIVQEMTQIHFLQRKT